MIEVNQDNSTSRPIGKPEAASGTFLGRIFMPLTRYMRAKEALSAIEGSESHLDIGCADCYFLLKSPCARRVGLDLRFGDRVTDRLDFPDESFTNVSQLAVIEHLDSPGKLIKEIHRVLKPGGRLILTTPKENGAWAMRLLKKDIDEIHNEYFDLDAINKLTEGLFELVTFREFMFGVNQLFVMRKC